MATMYSNRPGTPDKYYELVLTDYIGEKTRSTAIETLKYFCGITDRDAVACFDGLPDFKNVLVTSKNVAELKEKAQTLAFYGFSTVTQEVK
jgi:hypothetical protein